MWRRRKNTRSEFGKGKSALRPNVRPDPEEPIRMQDAERAQDGQSGLKPKNQFDPQIKLLPRPHLSGIAAGAMFDLTHPLKWLFSPAYRRKRREEKGLARKQAQHEERVRRSRRN